MNTHKLALLIIVFAISIIPLIHFWIYHYSYAKPYIAQLAGGQASIAVNIPRDDFMVWSYVATGFWDASLSYMLVVITSAIVVFPLE